MKMAEDYSDEIMEEMTKLQDEVDGRDAWDIDSKIEMAMQALRCPPKDSPVNNLSGGEARRVALCRLLLSKPDISSITSQIGRSKLTAARPIRMRAITPRGSKRKTNATRKRAVRAIVNPKL